MMVIAVTTLVAVPDIVNVEPQHHRMVFMDHVVAMHRIAPYKVAETEEQLDVIVLSQPHDVLAASLDRCRRVSVSADNLVFLEMNVYGMFPVKAALQIPRFRRVALHAEANIIAVKEFVVDDPLAISPVELELPALLRCGSRWSVIEVRIGSRIHAAVGHRVGNYSELEHLVSLARRHNVIARPRAVALLETILEPQNGSRGER